MIAEEDFTHPTWCVRGLIPASGLTILGGAPKLGKTWLALQIAEAVASGGEVLGCVVPEPAGVLFVTYESYGLERIRYRIIDKCLFGSCSENVYFADWGEIDLGKLRTRMMLAQRVRELGVRLVILDNLWEAMRDLRTLRRLSKITASLRSLKETITQAGAALLGVHFFKKHHTGIVSKDLFGGSAVSQAADMFVGLYQRNGKFYMSTEDRDGPSRISSLEVAFVGGRWLRVETPPVRSGGNEM